MKRLAPLILALCALTTSQSFAQDTQLIPLNQANPVTQMSITLPENTTGVVSINISQALVQVTDSQNNVVFSSADARVHRVELSFAPNTGSHVLTAQRLPGVDSAAVQVSAQPDLTSTGTPSFVAVSTLSLQQAQSLPLTTANPGGNTTLTIPQGTTGVMTATFPGPTTMAQVNDASGMVVASAYRDINGFNLVLDGGSYKFSLLASGLDRPSAADVQLMPANQFSLLTGAQAPAQMVVTQPCTAAVIDSLVSLRSGPGDGYTALDYGFQGDTFAVGGVNPDASWMVVGNAQVSAWLSSSSAQVSGDCSHLQIFNVPLSNSQPAETNLQPAPNTGFNNAPGSASNPPSRSRGDDDGESNFENG